MILCGKVVEHHSITGDLEFPEFIVYRPQNRPTKEVNSFASAFSVVIILVMQACSLLLADIGVSSLRSF